MAKAVAVNGADRIGGLNASPSEAPALRRLVVREVTGGFGMGNGVAFGCRRAKGDPVIPADWRELPPGDKAATLDSLQHAAVTAPSASPSSIWGN
jgi:hypothetical protein